MSTIKEKLDRGEKIPISLEEAKEAYDQVKKVSLFTKLEGLVNKGLLGRKKDKFTGGLLYTFEDRVVQIVGNFRGAAKWNHEGQSDMVFETPHDVAVDPSTRNILAMSEV